MNTSPRLILVLVIFGIGLLVVGATRMNLSSQAGEVSAPASPLAAFTTGLVGAALLATGSYLLRKTYLHKKQLAASAGAGNPRLYTALAVAILAVIAAIVFAVVHNG